MTLLLCMPCLNQHCLPHILHMPLGHIHTLQPVQIFPLPHALCKNLQMVISTRSIIFLLTFPTYVGKIFDVYI